MDIEAKLAFLLDHSQQFTPEHIKILDELTLSINSNSPQVPFAIFRPKKPMKYGGD